MRKEDRVYPMPKLPSPDQPQATVNRELIDAVKAIWIQMKDLRSAINNLENQ